MVATVPVEERGRGSASPASPAGRAGRAWAAAAAVLDPEVPCVTVDDLGILRGVELDGDVAVAKVTPTYSGCPAVLVIELAIATALNRAGFKARIERVLSPAWTTDWITEEGREKLRAFGIAPPTDSPTPPAGSRTLPTGSRALPAGSRKLALALFGETGVACPRCGSGETEKISEFGSTPCKAQYRCLACAEPFDYFKCL